MEELYVVANLSEEDAEVHEKCCVIKRAAAEVKTGPMMQPRVLTVSVLTMYRFVAGLGLHVPWSFRDGSFGVES